MSFEKNIDGENWGICGTINTGKTFIAMLFAKYIQRISNKKIIILNHNNNSAYAEYKKVISLRKLENADRALKHGKIYKVNCDDPNLFLEMATECCHDSILVLDDCGSYLRGNLTNPQIDFIKSTKNNRNDTFYQFHDFDDIAPILCRSLNMAIVKEQANFDIPTKMPKHYFLQVLLNEVREENNRNDPNKLWAYRVYDINRHFVYYPKPSGQLAMKHGREYFKQ